jgi:hypothetical protein
LAADFIRVALLDELSNRVASAVAIVAIVTGIVFAADYFASAQEDVPDIYSDVPLDASLLRLDRRALDEAYHDQLLKLFGVWMAEGAKDAQRIKNGLRAARKAYGQAASQIAAREQRIHDQHEQPK